MTRFPWVPAVVAALLLALIVAGVCSYADGRQERANPTATPALPVLTVIVLPTLAATPEAPGYARPDAGTRVPTPTVTPIPELILLPAASSTPTFTPPVPLVLPADSPTPRPRMIQKGGLVWTPG